MKAKVIKKILAIMIAASTLAATPGLVAAGKGNPPKNNESYAVRNDSSDER